VSRLRRQDLLARVREACVAGVVLLCQAAALIHAASAPHVTCPEHGDRVHLAAARTARHAGQLPVAALEAAADAHQHDHCGLQHQSRTPLPAPDAVVAITGGDHPWSSPGRIDLAAIPILSFAPKTSPPRAA
jgi:hypothetical protein